MLPLPHGASLARPLQLISIMQIKKQLITLGLSALLAQGVLPASLSAQQTKTEKVPGISLSDMDRKVRPQDNFYRYSNGGWIRKNPLKPAYSRFGTIVSPSSTSSLWTVLSVIVRATSPLSPSYKLSRESKPRKTSSSISLSRTRYMVKVASSARASQLTRRIVP